MTFVLPMAHASSPTRRREARSAPGPLPPASVCRLSGTRKRTIFLLWQGRSGRTLFAVSDLAEGFDSCPL